MFVKESLKVAGITLLIVGWEIASPIVEIIISGDFGAQGWVFYVWRSAVWVVLGSLGLTCIQSTR